MCTQPSAAWKIPLLITATTIAYAILANAKEGRRQAMSKRYEEGNGVPRQSETLLRNLNHSFPILLP